MPTATLVPMLRAPEAWPVWVVGGTAMVVLALLDLIGSVAAKEWSRGGGVPSLAVGVVAFLTLFWVYASALQYAELALVTLGWIVVLQVGLLLVDRFRYGVQLPTGHWVAVGVILVAEAYLLLAPASGGAGGEVGVGPGGEAGVGAGGEAAGG